ncbi:MAG: hypothetical protein AB9903_21690 [Vulcanimicrobiota bacterium]
MINNYGSYGMQGLGGYSNQYSLIQELMSQRLGTDSQSILGQNQSSEYGTDQLSLSPQALMQLMQQMQQGQGVDGQNSMPPPPPPPQGSEESQGSNQNILQQLLQQLMGQYSS